MRMYRRTDVWQRSVGLGRDAEKVRGVSGCGQCIGLLWERIPLGGRATIMQVHGRHTVATHAHNRTNTVLAHAHVHAHTLTRARTYTAVHAHTLTHNTAMHVRTSLTHVSTRAHTSHEHIYIHVRVRIGSLA